MAKATINIIMRYDGTVERIPTSKIIISSNYKHEQYGHDLCQYVNKLIKTRPYPLSWWNNKQPQVGAAPWSGLTPRWFEKIFWNPVLLISPTAETPCHKPNVNEWKDTTLEGLSVLHVYIYMYIYYVCMNMLSEYIIH